MNVTQRIEQLLAESGKSREAFAEYIGMNYKTLCAKFKNDRSFECDYLISICRFFDVTTDYLLTGEERIGERLTSDECELLDNYRLLSQMDKGRLLQKSEDLADKSELASKANVS